MGNTEEVTRSKEQPEVKEPFDINKDKANFFNSFFATVGKRTLEKMGTKVDEFLPTNNHGFNFQEETPETIKAIIDNLKANVAVGYDDLPAKIYKNLSEVLSPSICMLVNLSYLTSTFPQALKHAIVKPIYKNKGSQEDPQYYRPLSVLTILSKIFEKSAKNQLTDFLENNNRLYPSQHAYRRFHSTTTSLAEITDFLHWELEEGNIPAVVSTDLSKAFDTVSHPLLLRKLEQMELNKQSLQWIKSYLSKRTQETRFSEVRSETCEVQSGVPQGSILGPILFIAFTTDLSTSVPESKIVAYADDAAILVSEKDLTNLKRKIELCLEKVQLWYTNNGLLINPSKTEFMVLGNDNDINVTVKEDGKDISITSKKHLKVLGITVD